MYRQRLVDDSTFPARTPVDLDQHLKSGFFALIQGNMCSLQEEQSKNYYGLYMES
jgi:hypothetical protein